MSLRDIENYRLIDGVKIDNLPTDTTAELALKLDDVTAWIGISIDKTNPNVPIITNTWAIPVLTKAITFTVTADFAIWEVIDITTWTGDVSWTSDRVVWNTWAVDSLWIDAWVFNWNSSLTIADNKTITLKGVDAIWDSATTFHFTRALTIWEWFIIQDWESTSGGALWNTLVDWTLTITWNSSFQWTLSKTWSTIWTVVTYVDDNGWPSTINLPTAVWLLNQSFSYIRTDTSVNITTIDADGAEQINNASTLPIAAWESVTIISNDSNWFII